jgi:outer membrane protein assembly factor BamB
MAKNKSAVAIALFLILAMAFSLFALPTVNAQWYPECRPDFTTMGVNSMQEVDMAGISIYCQNVTFAVRYPGRDYFTTYSKWVTEATGRIANVPFTPNETGTYGLKFVIPWLDNEGLPQSEVMYPNPDTPDGSWQSNVALVQVLSEMPSETWVTNVYVSAQPLTGVNEEMFIVYWTDRIPPDIGEMYELGGRQNWNTVKLVITRPDGTNETYEMGTSDPVGGGYLLYSPPDVGEYSVVAVFPGEWKNQTGQGFRRWYTADTSDPDTFIVQEEPIVRWPEVPLPTDYWMRPIGGPANSWYVLAGNWLSGPANVYPQGADGGVTTNYGYGLAPESAHILWTRMFYPSGSIVDERFGTVGNRYGGYQSTGFDGNIILDGKIHLSKQLTVHDAAEGWAIWDLHTGEELSYDPTATVPSFGQIYWYDSGNEHGLNLYLWRTSGITLPETVRVARVKYLGANHLPERIGPNIEVPSSEIETGTLRELLDAYTGETICYIANVSTAGTDVYGKDGSILYYNAVNLGTNAAPNYYLQVWNSSAGTMVASQHSTGAWQWRPSGGSGSGASVSYFGAVGSDCVHDGNIMWSLNVSMPTPETTSIRAVREGEYVIFGDAGRNNEDGIDKAWFMAVSLEKGKEGTKLWETSFAGPFSSKGLYSGVSLDEVVPEYNVVIYNFDTLLKYYAYDLQTGSLLWETETDSDNQMGYYGFQSTVWNDTLIAGGTHSGVLYAYDLRTGEVRWNYTAQIEGTESPYGNALVRGLYFADGKVYTSTDEHSESSPLWRTQGLRCLNATTGEEIWKILFWGTSDIRIADGMLLGWNQYDGEVYAFGKGPSGTTVTASPEISCHGNNVMIKGTVTDQTPTGRRNINNLLQFSLKDTPAISDEDMEAWMEYKFMQQGMPADAKGVEVVLETLDPNGNFYEIGRTTTDITGTYGYAFEPEVPGTYQIIARFQGSASYYGSYAHTYLHVEEAPQASPTPTPPPPAMTDMYVIGFGSAALIAIIAIGVILILLRKR